MQIKAVKFKKNGFVTQPFALGGEDGPEMFDAAVRYRSCLQNFVIDTGSEIILVDTGLPKETPEMVVDENTQIFIGNTIKDYMSALADLGYKPNQVSKILVTHKHEDHTGELRSFPNAKIYIGPEDADAMQLTGDNIIRAEYRDGPYFNFPEAQKIAEGVWFIRARGHTNGNSIIIAESDGLFYMMHGDVTCTDEALYKNKLSVVFEDKQAARQTLNRVREFIQNHPTVYCSTHTPLGYENLEAKKVIDLSNPPESIPPGEIKSGKATGKFVCSICGQVYDPAIGDPEHGIPAGTAFEDLPADWKCPRCRQSKDKFNRA